MVSWLLGSMETMVCVQIVAHLVRGTRYRAGAGKAREEGCDRGEGLCPQGHVGRGGDLGFAAFSMPDTLAGFAGTPAQGRGGLVASPPSGLPETAVV